MNTPVRPTRLCPPGVYEDAFFSPVGGVTLRAIDDAGRCVDLAIVHTRGEYQAASERLEGLVTPPSSPSPPLRLV